MIKEFAKENKKLIGVILIVLTVIAGLTVTGKDDAIVADIQTMFDSLVADDAVIVEQPKLEEVK